MGRRHASSFAGSAPRPRAEWRLLPDRIIHSRNVWLDALANDLGRRSRDLHARNSKEESMPTYDAQRAQCLVFTFKEGMLSALAHDLKLQVNQMTIDVDEKARAIDARFDAKSLRVVTVMKKGVEAPGELGPD